MKPFVVSGNRHVTVGVPSEISSQVVSNLESRCVESVEKVNKDENSEIKVIHAEFSDYSSAEHAVEWIKGAIEGFCAGKNAYLHTRRVLFEGGHIFKLASIFFSLGNHKTAVEFGSFCYRICQVSGFGSPSQKDIEHALSVFAGLDDNGYSDFAKGWIEEQKATPEGLAEYIADHGE